MGSASAYAWFLRIGVHPDYPAVILPAVLLIGAAFGLGFSALNVQATSGVAGVGVVIAVSGVLGRRGRRAAPSEEEAEALVCDLR